MSALGRITNRALVLAQNLRPLQRNLHGYRNVHNVPRNYTKYLYIVGGGVTALIGMNYLRTDRVQASHLRKFEESKLLNKLTSRERRFIKFASVEYNGQLYMTPQDFLDSVVEQEPRPRLKRRSLTQQDLQHIKDETPPLRKGSKTLFRNLRDRGIVSYTEYLFLLSVLTKPVSGFRIAFNMFDTDGNQRVSKDEFLVILKILGGTFKSWKIDEDTRNLMERIFGSVWKGKRRAIKEDEGDEARRKPAEHTFIAEDEGLHRRNTVDTTLQVHFFTKKGDKDLHYQGFYTFMDNLQTEVLELEFNEFSKGNLAITEMDFAKILLRYTYLNADEYDAFLERCLDRVKDGHGISFEEFRDFCRFLNNLDDFSIAMRMYTLADRAISKDEFSRAVKICTGYTLTPHLIDTVFAIFDENGDGMLSYKEFIAIMKDRLHRGFKVSAGQVLEYNAVYNDYNMSEYPIFATWHQRICRQLDNYLDIKWSR